jgi:glucosamine--fructose-6-phosphate aminotransferase (isomerizing)
MMESHDSHGKRTTMESSFVERASQRARAGSFLSEGGMIPDIWGTPDALQRQLDEYLKQDDSIEFPELVKPLSKECLDKVKSNQLTPIKCAMDVLADCCKHQARWNTFTILGSGSSWHIGLVAEYLIEGLARIPVEVGYASEFRWTEPLITPGDVVIVISQSGETKDSLEALRMVKDKALTIAIVNNPNSTMARESDAFIDVHAGDEMGIASTKAFSATLMTLVLLGIRLGEMRDQLPGDERIKLLTALKKIPMQVSDVLSRSRWKRGGKRKEDLSQGKPRSWSVERMNEGDSNDTKVPDAKEQFSLMDVCRMNVLSQNFIVLGRGLNFPIALEGAMKFKEIAYMHAEGYPAAEMKHGPLALIDMFMPVVCIVPKSDPTYEKIKVNVEEVKSRRGCLICITESGNHDLDDIAEHVIHVPATHEYLMPLISLVPLQVMAVMMGKLRGTDVDKPRNLEKTVV